MKIDKKVMTIGEFSEVYSVGRTMVYELLKTGQLEALKSGGKTVITTEAAEKWLASLPRFVPGEN